MAPMPSLIMRHNHNSAIQTVQGNFSLRANSPLCQPRCLYGRSSLFQLYMWARRYSPTADNPGARLQKNNPVLSELQNHNSCIGFTLIEMLLAIALLSIVLVALYSTFFLSQRAVEGAGDALVRLQEGRMAIDTLRRELS